MRKYTVGIVQLNTRDDFSENLAAIGGYIEEAARKGAKLVSLPETANFIGERAGHAPEGENGHTVRFLAALAQKHGIYIHGGSIEENIGENTEYSGGRAFNTTFMLSPDGAVLAKYRKIHTFDVTLPDGSQSCESAIFQKGGDVVVAQTELGSFGFAICYDLRFPELFRLLALKGAQVIFLPACFSDQTGKYHWETLIRARAIENCCYVVAAAQTGKNARMTAFGNSLVADPWGNIVARAGDEPCLTLAEIDIDYICDVRAKMRPFENRREDVYTLCLTATERLIDVEP